MLLPDVIPIVKPISITPLAALDRLRTRMPELAQYKLGYAGRLDPMADGVLLVLIGDSNKRRKEFERLSKEYTFEFVCGFRTDTYDTLGMAEPGVLLPHVEIRQRLSTTIPRFTGSYKQDYPPYSAIRINGKSLFAWARLGKLPYPMPSKKITVNTFRVDGVSAIPARDLLRNISSHILAVQGDFRQQQILHRWEELLSNRSLHYPIIRCSVTCSSGVYIRGIVHSVGTEIGCGAVATRITRTQLGTYTIHQALQLYD